MNDWSKLKIASPEDPGLKDALLSASEQRQGSLEEFDFLKRQIEWRRKRYDEKDISLNLAERINTKIREQAYIEELDATYEALQENDFAAEEILLDVAKEQEAISKANIEKAEENGNDQLAEADEDDEADLPPFDIYLREGARIMSDWILIESSKRTASR